MGWLKALLLKGAVLCVANVDVKCIMDAICDSKIFYAIVLKRISKKFFI